MAEFELWCNIKGDRHSFPVSISPNHSIHELKRRIYAEGDDSFVGCHAKDLNLAKIDVDPKDPAIKHDIKAGQYQPLFNVQPLDSIDRICDVWPVQPSEKRLNVFVSPQKPTPPGQQPGVDNEKDLPWLKEVHSKIRDRKKDLGPKLFRTVKVTRACYAELQMRLREKHPDRDSPHYDGSDHDVGDLKIDVLRSLPDLSPRRHPDDNDPRMVNDGDPEASSEDDPDIKFPSTLRYLDLSYLELKTTMSTRLPLPLFIRQEYDYFTELIEKRPQSSMGSVIVSGQPGTGKTAYLHLRIIESMLEGRPFLYQAKEGTVYHVAEKGVEVVQSWSSQESITAFIDGNKGDFEPKDFLFVNFVQLIVTSPPEGAYQKWTKQTGYRSLIFKCAVKLWSLNELLLTGTFLHPTNISFKLLRESTLYFGYNPRQCFDASCSLAVLEHKKREVMSRIKVIASKGSDHILELLRLLPSPVGSDVPHTIFQIAPAGEEELRCLPSCKFEAVSGWALDTLLQEYNDRLINEAAEFYRRISLMPEAASFRSHLFERQALNYFSDIPAEGEFSIRRLTDSTQMKWTLHGPIDRIPLQESTVSYEIAEAVRNRKPLHLVPLASNFMAVDSVLYDPMDPNAVLTYIQVTMAKKDHPIVVSDLKRIQSWLKLQTPLEEFRPKEYRPWRFIFVVPKGMESTFKLRKMDGTTAMVEWAGKVDQYVLGLEEQTVFRRYDLNVPRGFTSE